MARRQHSRANREHDGRITSITVSGLESAALPAAAPDEQQALDEGAILHQRIAQIAYGLYLQRVASGNFGTAEEDWYRAEQQFLATCL